MGKCGLYQEAGLMTGFADRWDMKIDLGVEQLGKRWCHLVFQSCQTFQMNIIKE